MLKKALTPTFPKAITLAVIVCSFVMVKYQHPRRRVSLARSHRVLHKNRIAKKVPSLAPEIASMASGLMSVPSVPSTPAASQAPQKEIDVQNKVAVSVPQIPEKKKIERIAPATKRPVVARAHRTVHKVVRRHLARRKPHKKIARTIASPTKQETEVTTVSTVTTVTPDQKPMSKAVPDNQKQIDLIVQATFGEYSLSDDFNSNPLMSALQLGSELSTVATHSKSLEHTSLAVKRSVAQKTKIENAPEKKLPPQKVTVQAPVVAVPKKDVEKVAKEDLKGSEDPKGEVVLGNFHWISSHTVETSTPTVVPEAEKAPLQEAPEPEKTPELVKPSPVVEVAPPVHELQVTNDEGPTLVVPAQAQTQPPSEGPSIAPAKIPMTIQSSLLPQRIQWNRVVTPPPSKGKVTLPPQTLNNQTVPTHQRKEKADDGDNDDAAPEDSGVAYGTLEPDARFADWLTAHKAHIELYLVRTKSRDPQDTVFLSDYHYPERDFQIDLTMLRGTYRLVAGVYTPDSSKAVAQIFYSKPVSAENYKENIYFPLTKEAFDKAYDSAENAAPTSVALNLTLFEGASGNYRSPKPISSASVSFVGFPEWGTLHPDKEGNLRIAHIPTRSEILVHVRADGYYDTRAIVPIFDTDVYQPIYLVERDKVAAITEYFTKHPQADSKGVVLGRVFDVTTRAPKSGEQLSLSFRRGNAVYFDALPDLSRAATSDTGLFGFFNIAPSFRSVSRSSGAPSYLFDIQAGEAKYVELGRGGSRALNARLLDPFNNSAVSGSVRLVGDSNQEYRADENGQFEIPGIDLPPGLLTLEISAQDYPLIWQSLPWNSHEPDRVHSLFMLNNDVLQARRDFLTQVKFDENLGTVVGGAQASLFRGGNHCVTVELTDENGRAVSQDSGPYPLMGQPSSALCLTKKRPGFAYFNVPSGQYILKWKDPAGSVLRAHLVRVGVDRVSVVVN